MNAEKKLYTTKEAMRILGLTNNSGFFRKSKDTAYIPKSGRASVILQMG